MQYKIQPWQHQLAAIERAKDLPSFALFFEQGCGKTSTLINILRHKYLLHGRMRTLIICPQIVIENWRREILMHSEIGDERIITLTGSGIKRVKHFNLFAKGNPSIVITNYEALNMKPLLEKCLLPWAPEITVFDESHKLKSPRALRTRHALALSKTAKYRYLLSGTPIVNSIFDIYSQYLILDGGKTFGTNFPAFRDHYFIDENAEKPAHCYFPDWQPRMTAMKEINQKIYLTAARAEKRDCMDLPPFIRQTVEVKLGAKQAVAYKEMEQDAVVEFADQTITADLAIKKALRLQQILTGFIVDDEGNKHCFPENPRLNALEELIEQIGDKHKIIIWAVFKQNYQDITNLLKRLGISFVEVHGEVSAANKQKAVDEFTRGISRVLVGNPTSAGIGINLVEASYAIFYSRGFSLEADLQAEARNYRGGSEKHTRVTRIDIVAPATIDEQILTALQQKMNIADAIISHFNPQLRKQK